MNEEDMIIQEKIKKREKTDIMLAYMLIVILLGCILFVLYLKFIKNNGDSSVEEPTEYVANYIKLEDIASGISSNLNSKYSGITSNAGENSINVTYGDLIYDIPLINNELEFKMDNDNKELSEDIYKEIISSVCTYYNNDVDRCKNAAESITFGSNVSGVRFVNDTMYISVTNSVTPVDEIEKTTYTVETITEIENTDYEINMNDKVISNIKVDMSDVDITISGDLSSSGNVNVKIYDNDEKLLEEKSTDGENNFSISFEYNDNLNIDSIKKYSISIE